MRTQLNEQQKIRYTIRNQIEQIIKDKMIDRTRFHEVSKNKYQNVINKFYYSFCDYKKYPIIQLNYMWLRFHERLKEINRVYRGENWEGYIDSINSMLSNQSINIKVYMILDYGWVYEGYLEQIKIILKNANYMMNDFYIVSKQYDWFICHSDDADCLVYMKS